MLIGALIAATVYLVYAGARRERDYWSDLEDLFPPGEYLTAGCLCARGFRAADERCDCGWYR